jgi:hypothetical protein
VSSNSGQSRLTKKASQNKIFSKVINKGISLLLMIMLSNLVWAQIDTVRLNKYYFKKYWTDTKGIVAWIKFGAIVTSIGAISLADQPVADFAQSHKNKTLNTFSADVLEHFGAEHSFLVLSGIFTYGMFSKKEKCVSTALLGLESFLLASMFTRVPKLLIGRQRPDNWEGYGPYTFKGPFQGTSFPSGHTTATFAVASVIATQYRDIKWVPFAAYSVATLAGLSRVYDNRHWLSDVAGGAVVGTLVGNFVSRRVPNSKLNVVPVGSTNFQGISISYIW